MSPMIVLQALAAWLPELILSVGAMAVILLGVFSRQRRLPILMAWASVLGAAAALWSLNGAASATWFSGLLILDHVTQIFRWIALGVVALVMIMAATC